MKYLLIPFVLLAVFYPFLALFILWWWFIGWMVYKLIMWGWRDELE